MQVILCTGQVQVKNSDGLMYMRVGLDLLTLASEVPRQEEVVLGAWGVCARCCVW